MAVLDVPPAPLPLFGEGELPDGAVVLPGVGVVDVALAFVPPFAAACVLLDEPPHDASAHDASTSKSGTSTALHARTRRFPLPWVIS